MWPSRKSWSERTAQTGMLFLSLCILVLLSVSSCSGGNPNAVAEPARRQGAAEQALLKILPTGGEADGWAPAGEPMIFHGDDLFEHINGGADIYHEYGFVTLITQKYEKEDKGASIEIYSMDDPSAAFGIYSYNRHPTLSPIEVGSDGTIHSKGLFFWQGRFYADVRQLGSSSISHEEFTALSKAIENKIGTKGERPAIMGLLPSENMLPRSEVYAQSRLAVSNQVYIANNDLFRLEKGEAAAIARYRIGQPEFSVIVAEYGSEDACSEAFIRFRTHFLGSESAREKEFIASAMAPRHYGVRKEGARLVIVANANSADNALEMLDRVSAHMAGKG